MKGLNRWVNELLEIKSERTVDDLFEAMHGAYSKDKIENVLKTRAMVEDEPVNLRIEGGTAEPFTVELDLDDSLDEKSEDSESS